MDFLFWVKASGIETRLLIWLASLVGFVILLCILGLVIKFLKPKIVYWLYKRSKGEEIPDYNKDEDFRNFDESSSYLDDGDLGSD